tara:strand:+ start:941 stop:1333 length:393 start_codon:yes stop_codon:yes gene_type:complete
MSQISTGRPAYQKGQTTPKAPRKQMKRNSNPKDVCEPGKMFVSKALRDFAEGQPCQMQGPWCNGDNETTVLCHVRRGAGAGANQKPHDWWAYHGCSDCHAREENLGDRDLFDAIRRTQYAVFEHFSSLTP